MRPPGAGLPSPKVLEGSFRFPRRSSREKPSHTQSGVTPPHPVKETSLPVHSCHRAPQQCAGAVCKKRWIQGSGGGWYSCLVWLCVGSLEGALSGRMLRPAGRIKSRPMQGPFLSICYKSVLFTAVFGNEPPSLEEFMGSQVLDQQLPFPFSGTGVELASGKRLQVYVLHVHACQDIFRSELDLEMKGSEYSVWFGKENVKMWYRCLRFS